MDSNGIDETPEIPVINNSGDIQMEETVPIKLEQIETPQDEPEQPKIEFSQDDCEVFYRFLMETAHDIRKGDTKSLPDQRVKKQGELLYKICLKYDIKLPAIFQEGILAVGVFADWKYMDVKEIKEEIENEPETEINNSETT